MWPNQEYKICIGTQTANGFTQIKQKTVSLKDSSVKYDGGTYTYGLESFTHHKGRFHFAYYDKATGKLIKYCEKDSDVTPEDSDTRNARGLVKAAINAAQNPIGNMILIALCGLCIGVGCFIGFVAAPYLTPHAEEAAKVTAKLILGGLSLA